MLRKRGRIVEKYQLAVLEDNVLMREQICSMCGEILSEAGISYEITEFSKAEELEESIKMKEFHLLILDIVLEGMSGMELAEKLRMQKNRISILFLTGYESFWKDGFRVQPIQYLLKPVDRRELKKSLIDNWELNCRSKTAVFQKGNRILKLPMQSIHYIASGMNHSVEIHQENGVETFGYTLIETEQMLANADFVRCHTSYLVNLQYVREFDKSYFRLHDGTSIPIGRKYQKNCQSAMIAYSNR